MKGFLYFLIIVFLSSCNNFSIEQSNKYSEIESTELNQSMQTNLGTKKINSEFGFTINKTNEWKQVGDKLITNFQNMYNLHINYEPEDSDYPYKGWFFGWVKDQCNPGYEGCDAIYAAKSKSLTGPWLIYSGDKNDGSPKWTTHESIEKWVPVIAGGPTNYDNWHNGDPSVVKHKDIYYMAYSATGFNKDGIPYGQPNDNDSDISVVMGAISNDGLNWKKSDKPILIYKPQWGQPPMKKDGYMHEFGSYHRPSLMVEDDKFKLWIDAYEKNSFNMLYAENNANFMASDNWKILRGMGNSALINFPNPDIVKVEDLYLAFGDPVHAEAPEEGWGKRKITWAVSLNGLDWKSVGYMDTDAGWQGIFVPEALVAKDGDKYVINLTYGTMIRDHFHQDSIRMKRWILGQDELKELKKYAYIK